VKAGGVTVSGGGSSSASGSVFPLAHYGLTAASGDPIDFYAQSQLGNGNPFYTRVWIPANTSITNLYCAVATAGTHDGATPGNRLALYDDSGNLVDQTNSDNTLWTSTGWRGGALSAGPIAGQGAGRWVYAGLIALGMTVSPAIAYPSSPADFAYQFTGPGLTKRRTFYAFSGSFPASVNPNTGGTGTSTGYTPLIGIN
jgi:hypothetical protein